MRPALLVILLGGAALAQLPPPLQRPRPALQVYPSQANGLPPILAGECTGAALLGSRGEAVTVTRASTAYCLRTDGSMAAVTSGLPMVSMGAFYTEGGATNNLLYPRDLSQAGAWAATNATCAKTATGTTGDANSASTCTATDANATILQPRTLASAVRVSSVYVKRRTGTGGLDITRNGGTNWTALSASTCFNPLGIGTAPNASSWVHCWLSSTVTDPSVGLRIQTSGDAVDLDWWQDISNNTAKSPCDGGASTCTITTSKHTVANTLAAAPANPSAWCVGGRFRLKGIATWTSTNGGRLYDLGAAASGASNTAFLSFNSDGSLYFSVRNSAGADRGVSHPAISAGAHDVFGCSANGVVAIWVDGVRGTATPSGAGTGLIATQPATITIGMASDSGSASTLYVSDFRIVRGSIP